ncbi:hypothetical protein [Pseudomonas sp. PD9R]|uniref:hypothetical protein n=1 Tax=Pseudomonas sp. PD9R TaxID=2853534 RepID=UPI001C465D2A|nr:hypothetical protein [Pseudomonas sp. PD9R]MBV6823110.1 hypothetical protein [Pseudomonas sp. PD9R]
MESNESGSTNGEGQVNGFAVSQSVLWWGIAAVVLAILMCTFNNSAYVLRAGFFAKFFAVILGSIFGLGGALIGDALRRFAQPTSVYTSGGFFHLIWIKVFWVCGPQVIGLGIGVALGCSLVLK